MTWIETFSGKRFDLLKPKPEQVDLHDIAHALARINRFTGHTAGERGYSVAEHAMHVCALVEREHGADPVLCAVALHHDSAEAYVGDVSAPMKLAMRAMSSLWGAPGTYSPFDSIEESVQATILTAFRLPAPTHEQEAIVKRADLLLLRAEREVFLPKTGQHFWECLEGVPLDAGTCKRLRSSFWRCATTSEVEQVYRAKAETLRVPR